MLLPLPINSPHAPSLGLLQLFLHMSVLIPPKNLPDLSLSLSLIHPPPSLLAAYSKMQEEREKLWKKQLSKNIQQLMIWDSLRLSRRQRMLKLMNSLLGKHILKRRPRMWLDNLLLKRLCMWIMELVYYLRKKAGIERDKIIQERRQSTSCLMVGTLMAYMEAKETETR